MIAKRCASLNYSFFFCFATIQHHMPGNVSSTRTINEVVEQIFCLLLLLCCRDIVHKNTNISFGHDIGFPLLSILSSFLNFRHTWQPSMQCFKVIKVCHFCLDESSFKVSMNNSCRLWCQSALLNGPCSDFLGSTCVKRLQA